MCITEMHQQLIVNFDALLPYETKIWAYSPSKWNGAAMSKRHQDVYSQIKIDMFEIANNVESTNYYNNRNFLKNEQINKYINTEEEIQRKAMLQARRLEEITKSYMPACAGNGNLWLLEKMLS